MCVRSVFLLVLFSCVNSRPQDTSVSVGFLDSVANPNGHLQELHPQNADDPKPGNLQSTRTTVVHPGLPRDLQVFPLAVETWDHELQFNVTWTPYKGRETTGYTIAVTSISPTSDCVSQNVCYDCNIPGNATWWLIPTTISTIAGTSCAPRPGCAYNVTLHPNDRDGPASVSIIKALGECVGDVCSCAYSPRLPVPVVIANASTENGMIYAKINWTLQAPNYPRRLPSKLQKKSYTVSIGRLVKSSLAYLNFKWLDVPADGAVTEGDNRSSVLHWRGEKGDNSMKFIARVSLRDGRSCVGGEGNFTFNIAPPPVKPSEYPEKPDFGKFSPGAYAILVALIGASAMGAVFVLSARVVKRVLKLFRPAPVSAPLEPLRRRPAWFPLQLRT